MRKSQILFGSICLALASAASANELEQISEPPLAPFLVIEGEPATERSLAGEMEAMGVRTIAYVPIKSRQIGRLSVTGADVGESDPSQLLFQAASISKPVAAIGVLRLVQAHNLDLDADVNSYLNGWSIDYSGFESAERVTIRLLLSHQAGLNVHGFPGYDPSEAMPDTHGVLEGAGNTARIKLQAAPGSGFTYSGGGYTVLQLLVEEISGQDFASFMEQQVLQPIGMDNSHFRDAPGSAFVPAAGGNSTLHEVAYHVYPEKAAAGLWTTPQDLAKFALAVDSIVDGKMPEFLSPMLAAQLLVVPGDDKASEDTKDGYALGFGVDRSSRHNVFRHSGSNFGYKSIMFFDRASGHGFVAMTGSDSGNPLNMMLARGFANANELEFMEQRRLVPMPQTASDLDRISGVWTFGPGPLEGEKFQIAPLGENRITATSLKDGDMSTLLATGRLEFVDLETTTPLNFREGEDGITEGVLAGRMVMRKQPN